ncbi:ABC transporter ATP-binding protein [Deferrisoma sp.]
MLRVRGVRKLFGEVLALDGVDIGVRQGEITAVLGPSGSGKSTLLRIIAGLELPDAGEVVLRDRVVSTPKFRLPPADRNLGFVFQNLALWPHMRAEDHIKFALGGLGLSRRERKARVEAVLARVRMDHRTRAYPEQLSGGERQRLAIGRAIARHPDFLLMDEPFTGLDIVLREDMIRLTRDLVRERRLGVVYVTHDVLEAGRLADRVWILNRGRVAWEGRGAALAALTAGELHQMFSRGVG